MAVKLLIGGSPCTNWSIAQSKNRETKAEGVGWELFRNYLIAKEKFKPDFFLYENNKSAAQPIKDQIATELGVGSDPAARFTYINSALVSAQNRQRFYVTNFGDIAQPQDRGVLLKDILEQGEAWQEKSYALTTRCQGAIVADTLKRHRHTMLAEPVGVCIDGKSKTVKAQYAKNTVGNFLTNGGFNATGIAEPVCVAQRGRYDKNIIIQKYEARQDEKTNTLTTVQKDNAVCEPVVKPCRLGVLNEKAGQGDRIYSIHGKSVCLSATSGGGGAKTGLYAIAIRFDGEAPIRAVSRADGKEYPVYRVTNGQITIKDKPYPIKLADGYYIIRKLTVTECCRLQTMPEDYCRAVSAAQGYKGLGNGWTADVIIHLLNHALRDIPRDEEIVVLSLYDGIGTGRYCLDKMGFTNVKYHAYEIDKYAMQVAMSNYLDIVQHGNVFTVRENDWVQPQAQAENLVKFLT